MRVRLEKARTRAGDTIRIFAQASRSTRTITARVYGALPVSLRWNSAAKASTGDLTIPSSLPPGRYTVRVTAEDIAHNIGSQEVSLEVW